METFFNLCAHFVENLLNPLGYYGIVILMAIESACIPLPSEIIMPYGGYLVATFPGKFSVLGMAVAGSMGCVIGSILAYYVGLYGGRPFIEKYGKYILIRKSDVKKADKFFEKYGDWAVFIGRLLPIVRTFISFPAGVSKVNFGKFVLLTFLGSLPWCYVLAHVGEWATKKFPDSSAWEYVKSTPLSHYSHYIIGGILIVLIALYVWHHLHGMKEDEE